MKFTTVAALPVAALLLAGCSQAEQTPTAIPTTASPPPIVVEDVGDPVTISDKYVSLSGRLSLVLNGMGDAAGAADTVLLNWQGAKLRDITEESLALPDFLPLGTVTITEAASVNECWDAAMYDYRSAAEFILRGDYDGSKQFLIEANAYIGQATTLLK